eukprot:scaffold12397_cov68-Phaeocystis_antarctica.AAC.2
MTHPPSLPRTKTQSLDLVDGPTATRSVNRTILPARMAVRGPSRGPYTPLPPRFNDSTGFPPSFQECYAQTLMSEIQPCRAQVGPTRDTVPVV